MSTAALGLDEMRRGRISPRSRNKDPWVGNHTVQLLQASSISGKSVFYERAHIYIDSSSISGNACTPAEPLPQLARHGVSVRRLGPMPSRRVVCATEACERMKALRRRYVGQSRT
jgi:hypothetical protein